MNEYDSQNEIMVGGRRLRKIKRPKQYVAPLTDSPVQEEYMNITDDNISDANINLPSVQQKQMYDQSQPAYVEDDPYAYSNLPPEGGLAYAYGAMDRHKVFIIALACLLVGLLVGKMFFGGSSKAPSQSGLQGVILNPEVPQGRNRCGVAEKTQGCVLYLMNPERQELNGRDFYDWASQLTKRPRFIIETGNMRYSTVKIKPGFIAQINIPPLN